MVSIANSRGVQWISARPDFHWTSNTQKTFLLSAKSELTEKCREINLSSQLDSDLRADVDKVLYINFALLAYRMVKNSDVTADIDYPMLQCLA